MSKKVFSVTIDEKILSAWKKYTEEECINSSKLLEKMLVEYLADRKRNKK
jgi:metal-responsive CopG/Arc/MetJ family transcriptional regulator